MSVDAQEVINNSRLNIFPSFYKPALVQHSLRNVARWLVFVSVDQQTCCFYTTNRRIA